jgi:hypothetical protein
LQSRGRGTKKNLWLARVCSASRTLSVGVGRPPRPHSSAPSHSFAYVSPSWAERPVRPAVMRCGMMRLGLTTVAATCSPTQARRSPPLVPPRFTSLFFPSLPSPPFPSPAFPFPFPLPLFPSFSLSPFPSPMLGTLHQATALQMVWFSHCSLWACASLGSVLWGRSALSDAHDLLALWRRALGSLANAASGSGSTPSQIYNALDHLAQLPAPSTHHQQHRMHTAQQQLQARGAGDNDVLLVRVVLVVVLLFVFFCFLWCGC